MNAGSLIVTGASFAVGVGEALIYYNMGEAAKSGKANFKYRIPPRKELLKTAGVVLATSIVTALMVKGLQMLFEPDEEKEKA